MIKKITGEEIYQTINGNFSLSPSTETCTLQYSADAINWTDWDEEIPANETLIVTGLPLTHIFFRLKGNNSTLTLNF